jgi:23S rRNA (cytosine1962-C5)-methyltransferase
VRARRYQLRKEAVGLVQHGQPWIFRDHMSTATSAFGDGDWLRLFDGKNQIVGHGIYESDGAIAIRVLRTGAGAPDAAWWKSRVAAALARREPLVARTTGMRLLNGESDGIPAVVADRFGDTLVVASYSAGADALARYVARLLAQPTSLAAMPPPAHVLLRPARRRRGPAQSPRVLRGAPPEIATFVEDGLAFAVDLAGGHKTGTYLDLRGLRRELATAPLAGARVLNLFAYSGMLGRAAEAAGAAEIVEVDASERALAFAAAHHVTDASRHRFVTTDAFDYQPEGQFDLVIVDPPSMTSRANQIPSALAAYRKLYRAIAPHVKPGGMLVAACCTSRIEREVFHKTVREALPDSWKREKDLPPEVDHPVGFAQADYLKISIWRAV